MACPPEPPQDRDTKHLRPDFWAKALPWLNAVKKAMNMDMGIHETFRTSERQDWLYAQGRVAGCGIPGRFATWTRDSNHEYGLALDFHFEQDGQALWDDALYIKALRLVPPVSYGLESLAPTEYVHIQLLDADKLRTNWQPGQAVQQTIPVVTKPKLILKGLSMADALDILNAVYANKDAELVGEYKLNPNFPDKAYAVKQ